MSVMGAICDQFTFIRYQNYTLRKLRTEMNNKLAIEEALLEKLDTLVRLQAHSSVARLESQKEKILFLSKAGITPKDIADILGTTSNSVNVALSNARKASQESNSKVKRVKLN